MERQQGSRSLGVTGARLPPEVGEQILHLFYPQVVPTVTEHHFLQDAFPGHQTQEQASGVVDICLLHLLTVPQS